MLGAVLMGCGSSDPPASDREAAVVASREPNAPIATATSPTSAPEGQATCQATNTSVAKFWIAVALDEIRDDRPEPTIHARNLFHTSAAMWDTWAAYEPDATALFVDRTPTDAAALNDRITAVSFAAWHVLATRYSSDTASPRSPVNSAILRLCGVTGEFEPAPGTAAAFGIGIAEEVLRQTRDDGSFVDDGQTPPPYTPVNGQMYLDDTGTSLFDPNRWQPLYLDAAETRNGLAEPAGPQRFFAAHWGSVNGFALPPDGGDGMPIDPGPPPFLGGDDAASDAAFKAGIAETLRAGDALAVGREEVDLSPAAAGNRPLGQYLASGHPTNPATGERYAPNPTDLADYGRVIAEFWADGPDSETPPGHWNVLAIDVTDELSGDLRIGGSGPAVDRLEWDVKMFLALNGALHDAAVAAWGTKGHYDYVRPISMVRYMGSLGQSSDRTLPSFDPLGLLLEDGVVEIITSESAAAGERHAHLADHVDKIAVRGWLGQPSVPGAEVAGIDWILAGDWIPYQRPTFVTPAFAAYVSGHSTFSRAAAEVLTAFTGSAFFPGGLEEHVVLPGGLTHEQGPSRPVTLQWATYADAADEAGLSRLYGGIHVPADDLAGRAIGAEVGAAAWQRAERLFGEG